MSFELNFTPLSGHEESYVTLPKPQLLAACDALIVAYTKRKEELDQESSQYPFLDQEGHVVLAPWGKPSRRR